jgi:hypothetical protein
VIEEVLLLGVESESARIERVRSSELRKKYLWRWKLELLTDFAQCRAVMLCQQADPNRNAALTMSLPPDNERKGALKMNLH